MFERRTKTAMVQKTSPHLKIRVKSSGFRGVLILFVSSVFFQILNSVSFFKKSKILPEKFDATEIN